MFKEIEKALSKGPNFFRTRKSIQEILELIGKQSQREANELFKSRTSRELNKPYNESLLKFVLEPRNIKGKFETSSEVRKDQKKENKFSLFSQEQRNILEKKGFLIYFLEGKSIVELSQEGNKFDDDTEVSRRQSNIKTSPIEIAIPQDGKVLFASHNKTLDYQKHLVDLYNNKIILSEFSDTKAIIGKVNQYVELFFLHYQKTGKILFQALEDNCVLSRDGFFIGSFTSEKDEEISLSVHHRGNCITQAFVGTLPLIVPR